MAREMKNSGIEWIGDIPSEWETDRLQWHLEEIKVQNNPVQSEQVLSLTIEAGVIPYEDKGNQGNKAKENYEEYKLAYPDTLVVNSMNVIIGAVGISKYFGCVSPVYYVFKATENTDLRYIYYLFTNVGFQKEMRKYAKGILEIRLRISSADMLRRIIPKPSYEEQKRIADFLDRTCAEIDTVIEKTKATIEEYKKLKQSVITEAVTKGIRGDHTMKDSGIEWIGDIPDNWNVSKLKYVCQINTEFVDPRTGEFDNLPHIGPGNIEKFTGRLTEYKYVKDEGLISGKYHFYSNEIVYGKINPQLGKVTFPQFEGLCSADAYPIHTFEQIMETKFLLYFMLSRGFIDTTILASLRMGMPKINSFDLMNISIIVPSIEEQQKIVDFLDQKCAEIDTLIKKKASLLEEMESYKKSVIYEYVTGKKEVVL